MFCIFSDNCPRPRDKSGICELHRVKYRFNSRLLSPSCTLLVSLLYYSIPDNSSLAFFGYNRCNYVYGVARILSIDFGPTRTTFQHVNGQLNLLPKEGKKHFGESWIRNLVLKSLGHGSRIKSSMSDHSTNIL